MVSQAVPASAAAVPRRGLARPSPAPWLVPTILVLAIFYLYPVIDVVRLAFTTSTLLDSGDGYTLDTLTGTLARPELPQILTATAFFTAGSVIGQQVLGLAIALVVIRAEKRRLPGTALVRTAALVAWVVPGVAGGIIWKMLFNEAPFGGLNSILRLAGIGSASWLSDPDVAMWSLIISNVWRGTAFSMVVMYAAAKAIDPVLYEAAEVDGATPVQRLRHVTLPQLRTAILVNMILITIQSLNVFDNVLSLTGGGPGRATEVLALYAFNTVFRTLDLSVGAVLSLVMLAISLALAALYAAFLPKETEQ